MAAAKKPARKATKRTVTERNANGVERYTSRAAMQRHEKREPSREARREGERKGR